MARERWLLYDAFRIVRDITGNICEDRVHFNGDAYSVLNRQLFRHIALMASRGEAAVYKCK